MTIIPDPTRLAAQANAAPTLVPAPVEDRLRFNHAQHPDHLMSVYPGDVLEIIAPLRATVATLTAQLDKLVRYLVNEQGDTVKTDDIPDELAVDEAIKAMDALTARLEAVTGELEQSRKADDIILPTLERAKEILGAFNYENVDHAARRVVAELTTLRAQGQAFTAVVDAAVAWRNQFKVGPYTEAMIENELNVTEFDVALAHAVDALAAVTALGKGR